MLSVASLGNSRDFLDVSLPCANFLLSGLKLGELSSRESFLDFVLAWDNF